MTIGKDLGSNPNQVIGDIVPTDEGLQDEQFATPEVGQYAVGKVVEGWKKGMHIFKKFNVDEREVLKDVMSGKNVYTDAYNKKLDDDKRQIKDIIAQNDDFYIQHRNELQGIPFLLGGVAEGLANPYEMTTNIAVGALTGGLGIGFNVGAQLLADTFVLKTEVEAIEDRKPTLKEYAVNAAMGVLPDIAGHYISTKAKFNSNIELGDTNIDIRTMKEAIDDDGLYDGATKLAYQTQNNVPFDTDIADAKGINNPVEQHSPKTFLQRREQKYYESPKVNPVTKEEMDFIEAVTEPIDIMEGALKVGDLEIKEAVNVIRTGGKIGKGIELANTTDYIKQHYVNYEKQRVLVADEYRNILNKKPQQYLDEKGWDNKNFSNTYISGATDNLTDDKEFWDNVIKDKEIILGKSTGFNLDDLEDPESFIKRNSEFINENGTIKNDVFKSKNKEEVVSEKFINLLKSDDYNAIMRINNLDPNYIYEMATTKGLIAKIPAIKAVPTVNRLEFCLHKDTFLADVGKLYKTSYKERLPLSFKKGYIELADGVTPDMIDKYFDNDYFKIGKNASFETKKDTLFTNLLALQRSTNNAYGTPEYIHFGELANQFKDEESMVSFFTSLDDGKYLKDNSTLFRDIMEKQTKDISMIDNFGTTSPRRIKNIAKKYLSSSYIENIEKEIPSIEKMSVIKNVYNKLDLMIDNELIGKPQSTDVLSGVNGVVRGTLSRSTLYASGIQEFITNPALMAIKSARYGQNPLGTFAYSGVRYLKKIVKETPNNLPNQQYVIGALENDLHLRKHKSGVHSWLEKADESKLGYGIQQASDINLNKWGEIFATSTIDKLPKDITKIDPEVMRVLTLNNIDKTNYETFRNFSKKHIKDNGMFINSKSLLDIDTPESTQLRSVFNNISDNVGNIKSNNVFHNKAMDEYSKWIMMYRSFARAMNKDVINGALYYTTKEGLRKSRFSKGGIRTTFGVQDVPTGYVSALGTPVQASTVSKLGNIATVLGVVYGTGKTATVVKDLVYGDRDFSERFGKAQTDLEMLPTKFSESELSEFAEYLTADIINEFTDQTGLNLSMLQAKAPVLSTYNRGKALANKVDTNILDWAKFIARETFSRHIINTAKAIKTGANWDKSKKVWGYSKEENQKYYENVFNWRMEFNSWGVDVAEVNKKSKVFKARADYLEDKDDSFSDLPDNKKNYFNTASKLSDKSELELRVAKRGYALNYSEAQLDTAINTKDKVNQQLIEDLGVTTEEVDQYVESQKEGFNNLSEAKKKYYEQLTKYMNIPDTEDNQRLFFENLGNAKATDVETILKRKYNVDIKEFYNSIGVR
ncbi:MAG: hypothetical protein WCR79_01705 [Fusobacterium sp.]